MRFQTFPGFKRFSSLGLVISNCLLKEKRHIFFFNWNMQYLFLGFHLHLRLTVMGFVLFRSNRCQTESCPASKIRKGSWLSEPGIYAGRRWAQSSQNFHPFREWDITWLSHSVWYHENQTNCRADLQGLSSIGNFSSDPLELGFGHFYLRPVLANYSISF